MTHIRILNNITNRATNNKVSILCVNSLIHQPVETKFYFLFEIRRDFSHVLDKKVRASCICSIGSVFFWLTEGKGCLCLPLYYLLLMGG